MVYFIPTPIGNLDDITKRAFLALENVEIIFCEDTRVTKKLLNLLNIPLNKHFISMHSHNELKILSNLDINMLKTKECAYVSDAGMPGISDPGSKLIQFCQENEIPYTVLPGPSAFVTAYVASGFEGEFCFYMFLPHKGKERTDKLKEIMKSGKIAVLYESPHRIAKLIKEIQDIDSEREIFLAKEISKIHETYIKAKAKDIKLDNTKGEWVVIIDKTDKTKTLNLTYDEIIKLNLPLKEKSKLLAKISDKSQKEIYNSLLNNG
ncbi:16S rRNA (cytidine1402-2'-O)-methyltransferase [Lebetimonas natsushimae]|uniref:Ribosomal RNA small subunit methyltransferase I n=1 Tax=Lebetimonas natsushimae TaxID=1936991 RepID=A0A292YCJ5_9BACT|nr:16S rRNA (cytidine(1402)-2'-O)-methyltransferase [Lebetimonas natsushimae]GAX87090.1 16S rRNA (cytidine1402-2'-O)-methyltransferase [Lebetimonas natsushimae]